MPAADHTPHGGSKAGPPPDASSPEEWAGRLQQQWDAVLASLGEGRSAEDLRAMMELFLESQRVIAASAGSYFAALSGRPVVDAALERRLADLERRLASVERAIEQAGESGDDARQGAA